MSSTAGGHLVMTSALTVVASVLGDLFSLSMTAVLFTVEIVDLLEAWHWGK